MKSGMSDFMFRFFLFVFINHPSPSAKKAAFRLLSFLRKVRDSNPRYAVKRIPDFESSAFGHSANLPFYDMQS